MGVIRLISAPFFLYFVTTKNLHIYFLLVKTDQCGTSLSLHMHSSILTLVSNEDTHKGLCPNYMFQYCTCRHSLYGLLFMLFSILAFLFYTVFYSIFVLVHTFIILCQCLCSCCIVAITCPCLLNCDIVYRLLVFYFMTRYVQSQI